MEEILVELWRKFWRISKIIPRENMRRISKEILSRFSGIFSSYSGISIRILKNTDFKKNICFFPDLLIIRDFLRILTNFLSRSSEAFSPDSQDFYLRILRIFLRSNRIFWGMFSPDSLKNSLHISLETSLDEWNLWNNSLGGNTNKSL